MSRLILIIKLSISVVKNTCSVLILNLITICFKLKKKKSPIISKQKDQLKEQGLFQPLIKAYEQFKTMKEPNWAHVNFEPIEGKLVVWPSYIIHGSYPHLGKVKKTILSANLVIVAAK